MGPLNPAQPAQCDVLVLRLRRKGNEVVDGAGEFTVPRRGSPLQVGAGAAQLEAAQELVHHVGVPVAIQRSADVVDEPRRLYAGRKKPSR